MVFYFKFRFKIPRYTWALDLDLEVSPEILIFEHLDWEFLILIHLFLNWLIFIGFIYVSV